jgi:hypothetical protein
MFGVAVVVHPDSEGVLEFACQECRRVLGKRGLVVGRVLHRYQLDGTFIATEHVAQR